MCIVSKNISLILSEIIGLMNEGDAPCCVVVYKFNEQAAARNLIIISKIIVVLDAAKIDVSNMISLSRLIEGGAAMFHAENKNHHIDRLGTIIKIPFVKNILRV